MLSGESGGVARRGMGVVRGGCGVVWGCGGGWGCCGWHCRHQVVSCCHCHCCHCVLQDCCGNHKQRVQQMGRSGKGVCRVVQGCGEGLAVVSTAS